MADPTYGPKIYRKDGGNTEVIASGGVLAVESGGKVVPNLTVSNITTAGPETYTAAQIGGGVIARDPNGAARTGTTDTAAALIVALALMSDGDSAMCYLINTADAAEAITLAGGTGVTLNNAGQTIAQNESALLLFLRTSSTAVTLYIVGA